MEMAFVGALRATPGVSSARSERDLRAQAKSHSNNLVDQDGGLAITVDLFELLVLIQDVVPGRRYLDIVFREKLVHNAQAVERLFEGVIVTGNTTVENTLAKYVVVQERTVSAVV